MTRAVPSERVRRAIESGNSDPICGGLMAAHYFTMEWRKGRGKHTTLVIYAGDHEVQIHVSPTGSKVRVFVDGKEAS